MSRARELHSSSNSSSSSRKGKGQGEAQRKQSEKRKQARHSNGNAPQHPSLTPKQSTLQVWNLGGQPFLGHSQSRTIVPAVHKTVDNRRLVLGAGSQVHGGIAFGDNTSTSTSTVTNNNNNGSGGGGGIAREGCVGGSGHLTRAHSRQMIRPAWKQRARARNLPFEPRLRQTG